MRKARYLQNSHNCLQSAFASPDKYTVYLINLFRQEGRAAVLCEDYEKKRSNASKKGQAFRMVVGGGEGLLLFLRLWGGAHLLPYPHLENTQKHISLHLSLNKHF